MVIDAFLKSHPDYSIESAKDYIPAEYVDDKGAMVIFPPEHKIDGGFAVRLVNNG
jgi:16S rRNA C967 or C1407 C5-methylase (RsmB/RsmF family)